MRPVLDREKALAYLTAMGLEITEHMPVVVIGIRGGLEEPVRKNKIGIFDDVLAIVTPDLCEAFTGNTDPSTEIVGRANLVVGVHRFKPGLHHPDTPKAYPAFVQDRPIVVFRYGTENEPSGMMDDRGLHLGGGMWKGEFYIHIHNAMGENTTGSEGCQTIIKHEWNEFQSMLMKALADHAQANFPYVLVEA